MLTFKKRTADSENYIGAIKNLSKQLDDVTKQITYLDAYNIIDSVEAKEFFNAKVNALPPNSSLVINADEFSSDGVSYNRGDIILKDAYSRVVHIKSQTGGVYFPVKIEQEKNKDDIGRDLYTIVYEYRGEKPSPRAQNDNSSTLIDEKAKFEDTIRFSGFTFSPNVNSVYGLWQPASDPFPKFKTSSNEDADVVQPYIKFYTIDDKKNPAEEVVINYSLSETEDGEQFVVNVDNSLNLWMKVK